MVVGLDPMPTYMHTFFNEQQLCMLLVLCSLTEPTVMAFHFPSTIALKKLQPISLPQFFISFFYFVQWQSESEYSIYCSLVLFLFPAKEVKKAPMFLEKLQNCGVPEGYPVRLECRVVGMPPPVFYWKKDNETIPSNRERMRYCNSISITEVSCSQTNCFYHTAFYWNRCCSS